jgi:glycerol-3-phosphate dehydrogenase (NAD(P)+)
MNISILGAGAWGTALAILLCQRHSVLLWVRSASQRNSMARTRSNERYLPGFDLPAAIKLAGSLPEVLDNTALVIVAVPSSAFRKTLCAMSKARVSCGIVWVCKGLEPGGARLLHEVFQDVFPDCRQFGILSGPSFAEEVARGLPTAMTLATPDAEFARLTAAELATPSLRLYTTDDVVGVELGGAVKNIMAIAAGIADGLGLGLNARAALITRGLAEMSRLGLKLGAQPETFMGLAGAGDLVLTCTGELSRNRAVGLRLAKGEKLDAILKDLGHTAEGVPTAKEVVHLAGHHRIEMPITQAVYRVLYEQLSPRLAVEGLLSRKLKAEKTGNAF